MAIPTKIKKLLGVAFPSNVHEIEKGQIRRFAAAVGEDSAIHFDQAAAKAAGFSSLVAPPSFTSAITPLKDLLEVLDMDQLLTMHSEENCDYFRPICAGDVLTVTHKVVDAYEQQTPNGKMLFLTVESVCIDKKERLVFTSKRLLVEAKR
ncbi:MaoC family dehydratase N-terminal domain-containing protein [Myxococcota bacterium]|nr:MaoC family dehydratase N-terminal domain-containing protein [Myxococcota bacterium]